MTSCTISSIVAVSKLVRVSTDRLWRRWLEWRCGGDWSQTTASCSGSEESSHYWPASAPRHTHTHTHTRHLSHRSHKGEAGSCVLFHKDIWMLRAKADIELEFWLSRLYLVIIHYCVQRLNPHRIDITIQDNPLGPGVTDVGQLTHDIRKKACGGKAHVLSLALGCDRSTGNGVGPHRPSTRAWPGL